MCVVSVTRSPYTWDRQSPAVLIRGAGGHPESLYVVVEVTRIPYQPQAFLIRGMGVTRTGTVGHEKSLYVGPPVTSSAYTWRSPSGQVDFKPYVCVVTAYVWLQRTSACSMRLCTSGYNVRLVMHAYHA